MLYYSPDSWEAAMKLGGVDPPAQKLAVRTNKPMARPILGWQNQPHGQQLDGRLQPYGSHNNNNVAPTTIPTLVRPTTEPKKIRN